MPKWELSDADGQAAGRRRRARAAAGDEEESLFGAAYEQVTYRDTTDDGMESSTFDTEPDETESELSFEVERITDHLQFLATLGAFVEVHGHGHAARRRPAGRAR